MDDGNGIDLMRAVVVGGADGTGPGGAAGIVARFPGLVCVAAVPDGGPGATPVRTLLDLCAAAAGDAPGRPLGQRLARWLGGPEAPEGLVFGTVAAADDRLAVFLSGAVSARLPGAAEVLSGLDAVAWTDRLVPRIDVAGLDGSVVLALDAAADPDDLAERCVPRPHDLRSGIVPGTAVALLPAGAEAVEATAGEDAGDAVDPGDADEDDAAVSGTAPLADPAEDGDDGVAAEVSSELRAPRPSARIGGEAVDPDADPAPRPPLPAGDPPAPGAPPGAGPARDDLADAVTERSREPLARGYVCVRGHLNDPRSHFCVLCGIRMDERTGVLTTGPRPPLGLLVFDDGGTFTVDAEYLVGRAPETDPRVDAGELRELIVEDRGGTVSRVHAEVRIRDWDVLLVDAGSRNGSFVVPPGAGAWERAPERRPVRLEPGTRVRLGHHRTFVFESPSGVR